VRACVRCVRCVPALVRIQTLAFVNVGVQQRRRACSCSWPG
jgi:hypothetical protein